MVCESCNNELDHRTKANRFCSLSCYWNSMKGIDPWENGRRILKGKDHWNWGNRKEYSKLCLDCGEERKSRYSLRCKSCNNRILKTGTKHSEEHKRKISEGNKGRQCYWLGKKMSLETREKMSSSHKALVMAGIHPRWKGGVTLKEQLERSRFRMTIQKRVFERDNYTCQLCGEQQDLQVDHIQSWAEYIELRFSMDNCRTLCKSCHYQITYGKPIPYKSIPWGRNFGRRVAKFERY